MKESNVSFLRNCWVCGNPFLAKARKAKSCARRECLGCMAVFRETYVFDFIMLNSRFGGGSGLESIEEQLQRAIEKLPSDEGPLAELLIGIIENQDLPEGYSPW
jgi:hypothetical protein